MQGWERRLDLRLRDGVDRTGDALAEVEAAIAVERRVQTRPHAARIEAIEPLSTADGLWRLRLSVEARRGRAPDWRGASLRADLAHGAVPWAGELLHLQGDSAVVAVSPPGRPEVGSADVRPFDFLAPSLQLVTRPDLRPIREAYRALLEAAAGWRVGRFPVRDQLGPWGWSWAALWGPPGTGKTHTLVQRLRELLDRDDERVLVVSTTNRATDEIARRAAPFAHGRLLRVGRVDVSAYPAGTRHVLPDPPERLAALEEAQRRLSEATTAEAQARWRRRLGELHRSLPSLSSVLAEDEPRCVVTTLHAALRAVVSSNCAPFHEHGRAPFTTAILDEAGLVSRAAAAAVGLLAARQVVLVGDPRQLSPICVASRSLEPRVKRWLASSALSTVRAEDDHVEALNTQHRMHPDVRAAVSALSYEGRLQDAPTIADRPWPNAGPLRNLPRALHLAVEQGPKGEVGAAASRGEGGSWLREGGLDAFDRLLHAQPQLLAMKGMFITPYRAQAVAAADVAARAGAVGWSASTIHAQQGAEADVVFFDLVRGTGWPTPEFRRLVNVALSRARHLVIVCATTAELGAGWLAPLRALPRFVIDERGLRRPESATQASMFGGSPEAQASTAPLEAGRSGSGEHRPVDAAAPWTRDDARLGVQIEQRRAIRRTLTRAQARLVEMSLKDLGPRIVRGVAGSGKTVVLARWAAAELVTYPERTATVLYGNRSLKPHLDKLLRAAWRITTDGRPFPEDRVQLLHVGELLRAFLREQGAQLPRDAWDLPAHVARIDATELQGPRFGLLYIDEAQDLGHDALALLLGLVDRTEGFPVRVFYDNAQNVYGATTPTWADFGVDARGRSVVLRESFRTTRQAMELALNLLDRLAPLKQDADLRELMAARGKHPPLLEREPDGWWRADHCVVRGQPPEVGVYDRREAEHEALVEAVVGWIADRVRPRDIRVLALARETGQQLADALRAAGVEAVCATGRAFRPDDERVVVTTPQSFKGYEAEVVAVVGLERFAPPPAGPLVSVLYVAMTRARTLARYTATRVSTEHTGAPIVEALERAAELQAQRD